MTQILCQLSLIYRPILQISLGNKILQVFKFGQRYLSCNILRGVLLSPKSLLRLNNLNGFVFMDFFFFFFMFVENRKHSKTFRWTNKTNNYFYFFITPPANQWVFSGPMEMLSSSFMRIGKRVHSSKF